MASRTIGSLSPRDMGSGLEGRSPRSRGLAEAAGIEDVGSDRELLSAADIIISASMAVGTAERIITATNNVDPKQLRTKYYIDANAIAPATTKQLSELFPKCNVQFIDGSIIGGPPRAKPDGSWYRPTFALSGPNTRELNLDEAFDTAHVGPDIGQASALKMSFASLTKGFTAVAIQSLGTAHANGLLNTLLEQIKKHTPNAVSSLDTLTVMPPKAYRWFGEMEEISKTFANQGFDPRIFQGAAEKYRWISEETELGKEVVEHRDKGKDIEDVCNWIVRALHGAD